jgi:hypothetical protein
MWRFLLLGSVAAGCSFTPSGQVVEVPLDSGASFDTARPAVAPPRAYWSFDVDGRDLVGPHSGTLVGTAQISAGGGGRRGEALLLDASSSRFDIGDSSSFDFNADFTWHIYIRTSAQSGALFSRNPAATAWNQGSKALFIRGGTVQWDSGWVSNPHSNVAVADGAWHQVIATYVSASDSLDLFVDPPLGATTGQFSGVHDVNKYDEHRHVHLDGLAESGFSIGAANFSGGLADLGTLIGSIDEAAVFDRALRGAELDLLIGSGPVAFLP